jgi:hypothetical protein
MNEPINLDAVRAAALQRIDQAERRYKFGIVAFAFMEALFGGAFLLLMDFSNRLHWLLLVMALLIYATLSVGIFSLGAYIQASTQGLLNAILQQRQPNQPTADQRP